MENVCDYCSNDKLLLQQGFMQENYGVFIGRGYLRLVPMDDRQCIGSGEKIVINFCPMCGEKVNEND